MKKLTITVIMEDDDIYLDPTDSGGITEEAYLRLSEDIGMWGDDLTTTVTDA
ncbi:MAG: hypothetical protein V3U14_13015 [candidate division NC10 bacterium]